jgi:hypothetical protein
VYERQGMRRADAPDEAGASRDGWSGARTGSATGREGEPITDITIIGGRATEAKFLSSLCPGPFVLNMVWAPSPITVAAAATDRNSMT